MSDLQEEAAGAADLPPPNPEAKLPAQITMEDYKELTSGLLMQNPPDPIKAMNQVILLLPHAATYNHCFDEIFKNPDKQCKLLASIILRQAIPYLLPAFDQDSIYKACVNYLIDILITEESMPIRRQAMDSIRAVILIYKAKDPLTVGKMVDIGIESLECEKQAEQEGGHLILNQIFDLLDEAGQRARFPKILKLLEKNLTSTENKKLRNMSQETLGFIWALSKLRQDFFLLKYDGSLLPLLVNGALEDDRLVIAAYYWEDGIFPWQKEAFHPHISLLFEKAFEIAEDPLRPERIAPFQAIIHVLKHKPSIVDIKSSHYERSLKLALDSLSDDLQEEELLIDEERFLRIAENWLRDVGQLYSNTEPAILKQLDQLQSEDTPSARAGACNLIARTLQVKAQLLKKHLSVLAPLVIQNLQAISLRVRSAASFAAVLMIIYFKTDFLKELTPGLLQALLKSLNSMSWDLCNDTASLLNERAFYVLIFTNELLAGTKLSEAECSAELSLLLLKFTKAGFSAKIRLQALTHLSTIVEVAGAEVHEIKPEVIQTLSSILTMTESSSASNCQGSSDFEEKVRSILKTLEQPSDPAPPLKESDA